MSWYRWPPYAKGGQDRSGLKEGLSGMATGTHGTVKGSGIAVVPAYPDTIAEPSGSFSKRIVPWILARERLFNGVALQELEWQFGFSKAGADLRNEVLGIGSKPRAEGDGNESSLAGGIAGGHITGHGEIGKGTPAAAVEDDKRFPQGAPGG